MPPFKQYDMPPERYVLKSRALVTGVEKQVTHFDCVADLGQVMYGQKTESKMCIQP